ncbi:acyl-ACP desaturase [Streptomyces sp. MNP-20]|uniref:acyl-ACP desaturase n=1 Tax=Streptomyces sp. MNP-20 TaxID=2721165 RepID=UPI00281538E8|nr:acyl-ACP desaturase [Streptomyces sp. MNP-20]
MLQDLLQRLARDEARHFALYTQLVTSYLEQHGERAVPYMKQVLSTFRMPLANTLNDYWRWSLKVAAAVGYDHTEAYDALGRLVREYTGAPGERRCRRPAAFHRSGAETALRVITVVTDWSSGTPHE